MRTFFTATLLLIASSISLLAQTSTGSLKGTVSSPDGSLPGASVTVTDAATNKTQTITTNDSGQFTFAQLDAGNYTVRVSATGFKTFVANEVKIDVGREYSLNPQLEIGTVTETVTVTAGADIVTATTAQVSNTVSPQQILSLPLVTRNPLSLTTLQAGVQSNPFQNTTINGMRTSFTNITRDGINIQDNFIRSNATDFAPGRPTVDDTAEFTIITNNQEADQGYGGAQIRLTTPRGGKDFSGALFYYNRNSALAANNFFANRTPNNADGTQSSIAAKPPYRNRNQFGGKIGGPLPLPGFGEGVPALVNDKGFFFFSYEKIIDPISSGFTRTILTPSARAGAFQYNRTVAGSPINSGGVSCPSGAANSVCTITDFLAFARASNLPFTAGAPIPTGINPIIQQRIINQLPAESNRVGGDGLNTAGYFLNRQQDQRGNRYTGRIDVDFTSRDTINGVYAFNDESNLRTDLDTTGFTQTPLTSQTSANKTLALAYRRIATSNIVNELRGGLFFSDVPFQRDIPNPSDYLLNVLPVTNPEVNFQNQGRSVKTYNIQDNVDWIAGKHSLRFGGQMQWFRPTAYNFAGTQPLLFVQTVAGVTPTFTASNFTNFGGISTTQLGTANQFLGFFGGFVVQGQQTFNLADINAGEFTSGPSIQPYQYENHSLYFADRWQITNSLTLNLGVRYELFPSLRLANGLALEPVIGDDAVGAILNQAGTYRPIGGNAGRENAYYKTDYDNFAPNVGFAWAPQFRSGFGKFLTGGERGRLVIRGGYSRAFGNDQLITGIDNAASGNVGLASRTGFLLDPTTGSNLVNLRLGVSPIAAFTPPAFVAPPFTYIRNNTTGISGTANFGTVFGIEPNLQVPSIDQYSFGIQREFAGNLAFEIRYVGTKSGNLPRSIDYNQIDIFNNGFLAEFNRAATNFAITEAERARLAGTGLTAAQVNAIQPQGIFCTAPGLTGCQALTIFQNGGTSSTGRLAVGGTGNLTNATLIANLQNGTPAELAFNIIQLGFNNPRNLTNPTANPFINFVPNPSTGVADLFGNFGRYRYDSLQVELRRRFSQGLYFQANYTFSKNLTNAQGNTQTQFEPNLDNNRPELEYQRADTDQTHIFNFNGAYQLPFGRGRAFLNRGGWSDRIFGGFELSGIVSVASGAPISFLDPRGTVNRAGRSGRQTALTSLTADQLRDLTGVFERNGRIYYINPDIIDPVTGAASNGYGSTPFAGQVFFSNAPGQTGSLRRAVVDGPRTWNVNAALLKNIRLGKEASTRLQLRFEAFNLFNNVNFFNNTQAASIYSTTFGQVTSAGASRTVQLAARLEF
jgi:hypothetical protein